MAKGAPYADTQLAKLVSKRILELRPRKLQNRIAIDAGFPNVNMLNFIKTGKNKLALERVPGLAQALEVDPRLLLRLALEQTGLETQSNAVDTVLRTVVSENEAHWLHELRDASDNSDPPLSARARRGLRAIFNK